MSLLKVDPLPPYKYFAVHASVSVEDALDLASSVNHSLADLLNLYSTQSEGEFTNLSALLIEHDDALDGEDAMNLLRLLASLGDACLCLRLLEEGTAEIAERLSKEKPA